MTVDLVRTGARGHRRDWSGLVLLCASWNEATNPRKPRTDIQHARCLRVAYAVQRRINALGFTMPGDFVELEDGRILPATDRRVR